MIIKTENAIYEITYEGRGTLKAQVIFPLIPEKENKQYYGDKLEFRASHFMLTLGGISVLEGEAL